MSTNIEFNPSERKTNGKRIVISHIIRCPKSNSKRSASMCRICEYYIASDDRYVICSYEKRWRKK